MYLIFCLIISLICFQQFQLKTTFAEITPQCDDWEVSNNRKCIKVFVEKNLLQSYNSAQLICSQNENSKLISIHSKEENEFLISLIHNKYNIRSNVWLGGQYYNNALHWNDNSDVNYTNFDQTNVVHDNNQSCVQMSFVFSSFGKWFRGSCHEKNLVACQKSQSKLFLYFQNQITEMKLILANAENELKNAKIELNDTKDSLLNLQIREDLSNQMFDSVKFNLITKLEDFENELINLKNELNSTKNALNETKSQLNDTMNRLLDLQIKEDLSNQIFESTTVKINSKINDYKEEILQNIVYTNKSFEYTKLELKNELLITNKNVENTKKQCVETKLQLKEDITKYTPTGTIAYFATMKAPDGWLKANGQSVSRTSYAKLFAIIGITFGSGDGGSTFQLPDLRGEFIRGWSDGRDVDKSRSFGSFQLGSSIPFVEGINDDAIYSMGTGYIGSWIISAGATFDEGYSWVRTGQNKFGITFPKNSNENRVYFADAPKKGKITAWNVLGGTRPRNVALLACIKY